MQKRRVVCRNHPDIHLAAFQEFVKLLVTLPVHQGIDFIETLVPLFLNRRFPREPGGLDLAWVEVAVADDVDGITAER